MFPKGQGPVSGKDNYALASLMQAVRKDLRRQLRPIHEHLDLRGFDSSRFVCLRDGIPRSIGKFAETQTRRLLVCGFSVCGLTTSSQTGKSLQRENKLAHQMFRLRELTTVDITGIMTIHKL